MEAITYGDYPIIEGFLLVMTFTIILANLIVDILYVVIDPRIKLE